MKRRTYLGMTAKRLDAITIYLRHKTATSDLKDGLRRGCSGGAICGKADDYWRETLGCKDLPVTVTMLQEMGEQITAGPRGVIWWICDQVYTAADYSTYGTIPDSVGWSYGNMAPYRGPIQWKEAERWLKAALLWDFVPRVAEKLAEKEA